jgi:hypothetical protein
MSTAAKSQPVLTDAEWELVLQLLEHERNELPSEIHHTRTFVLREELRRRLEMVDSLIARLRRAPAA